MLTRILTAIAGGLFLVFSSVGFLYFGPVERTGFISQRPLFQQKIAPFFDALFSSEGFSGAMIGYLSSGDGDLTFRPSSELVFLPARVGQRLSGGTVFSSGEESSALITLVDNSQITLEPNSTVLLEVPRGTAEEGDTVSLKVIKGALSAEKTNSNSKLNLRIETPRGRITKVLGEKLLVVTTKIEQDPRALKTIKELLADTSGGEYLGSALKAPNIKDIERELKLGKASNDIKGALPQALSLNQGNANSEQTALPVKSLESASTELLPGPRAPASSGALQQDPLSKQSSLGALDASALGQAEANGSVKPEDSNSKLSDVSSPDLKSAAQETAVNAADIDSLIGESQKAVEIKVPPAPVPKAPRVVGASKRSTVKKSKVVKFAAGPDGNDITNALFASRQGDSEASQRLLASALTRKEYHSDQFNDAFRVALDGIMDGHVKAGDCELALDQYGNVERGYPDDSIAKTWLARWKIILDKKCR